MASWRCGLSLLLVFVVAACTVFYSIGNDYDHMVGAAFKLAGQTTGALSSLSQAAGGERSRGASPAEAVPVALPETTSTLPPDPCLAEGAASPACVKSKLEYWKSNPRLTPEQVVEAFPRDPGSADGPRYVTHEVDFGGFNNIRQGFEVVIACALLTGRTLVLPPPRGWYLINWGPQKRNKHPDPNSIGTLSSYADFFDVDQLRKFIPVISTAEFIERERKRFDIPKEFTGVSVAHGLSPDLQPFDRWIRNSKLTNIMANWNPLSHVVCWPDLAHGCSKDVLSRLPNQGSNFLRGRRRTEYDAAVRGKSILHFPMDNPKNWRYLGQIASLAVFQKPAQDRVYHAFFRDANMYHPAVFDIASKIIAALGGFGAYASLHVRRNDIYKQVHIAGSKTAEDIKNLLKPGEKLYLSTDETRAGFFDILSKDAGGPRKVLRWDDFVKPGGAVDPSEVSYRIGGLIEQVVCAGGRVFIGTQMSTFSGFIPRLRGYMDAVDKSVYYHTKFNEGPVKYKPWKTTPEYMMESSTMWEDV